jgi:hypothetical protein
MLYLILLFVVAANSHKISPFGAVVRTNATITITCCKDYHNDRELSLDPDYTQVNLSCIAKNVTVMSPSRYHCSHKNYPDDTFTDIHTINTKETDDIAIENTVYTFESHYGPDDKDITYYWVNNRGYHLGHDRSLSLPITMNDAKVNFTCNIITRIALHHYYHWNLANQISGFAVTKQISVLSLSQHTESNNKTIYELTIATTKKRMIVKWGILGGGIKQTDILISNGTHCQSSYVTSNVNISEILLQVNSKGFLIADFYAPSTTSESTTSESTTSESTTSESTTSESTTKKTALEIIPTPSASRSNKVETGVGATVGVLFFLVIICGIVIYLRRRREQPQIRQVADNEL